MQRRLGNIKTKPKKGTFIRLMKYVFKLHKFKLLLVILLMILSTVTNVGATYFIQKVVKVAVEMVNTKSTDFTQIISIITLMIILYLTSIVFTYLYLRIMVTVGQDTLFKIRNDLFKHMMTLPLKFYDTNSHGDLMSRFTNDVDATRQMISQSLPNLITTSLMIVGYLAIMIITSPLLSILSLVMTVVLITTNRKISKSSHKYFFNQQKSLGEVNGFIEEMIEGQKVVKVFRQEDKVISRFEKINEELYQNGTKSAKRMGMVIPITINMGYLTYAITALVGSYLISKEYMTIDQLVGYMLYTRNFISPINQFSQQLNFVNLALAGASRIFDIFDQVSEVNEGKIKLVNVKKENNKLIEVNENTNMWAWKKEDNTLVELLGDVRFENVTFSYNENKEILHNISLYAKPGQKIAFVGATGAGKTTITNLINRFYEIQKGVITYDGINIKDINKDDLRKSLGMVLQDTSLFEKTIMENIRYGKLDASDEEVIEACKVANAHDFIMKLPDGYNTLITDNGTNLSQGQRQLLSIARAVLSNPPVLILDEATSSIDTYTEKLIQNAMDELMKNRTVFVIAHRLSTIRNSKAIMVLENGNIIERGNHADLIGLRGRYYQLYTGLFELE